MKKLLALLLAAVMLLGMLTACNNAPADDSKAPEQTQGNKEPANTTASKETEPAEPAVVTWYTRLGDLPADWELVMEDLNKKLVEKINVILDLQVIPAGDFNDKMTLASTSGDTYEVAWTSNWSNKFDTNMARGAFMPLDDLINEYGQGILENCPEWLLDVGRVNGELYAIPCVQLIASGPAAYIPKALAAEYGWTKEHIDSVTELYPFLDWVKEKHPELVPLSPDSIGNDYSDNRPEKLSNYLYFDVNDGSKLISVTEASKNGLKMMREWYEKGYIREDAETVANFTEDRITGRYACLISTGKPGGDAAMDQRYNGEYMMCYIGNASITTNAGQETMLALNVNADEPEAAMKLMNLLWTDKEIFNELLFGLENVHYVKVGENRVKLVENSGYYFGGSGWYFANACNTYVMDGQTDDVWELTEKMNNEADVSDNRGFVPDYTDYQTELAQLSAVMGEYKVGFLSCDDLDAWIAERDAKLQAAGLQTLLDGIQDQLDAWRAANGK